MSAIVEVVALLASAASKLPDIATEESDSYRRAALQGIKRRIDADVAWLDAYITNS